jgi:hypothetical protein
MILRKCTRPSGNKTVQIGRKHGKLPRSDASEFSMDLDESNGKRVSNIAMNSPCAKTRNANYLDNEAAAIRTHRCCVE